MSEIQSSAIPEDITPEVVTKNKLLKKSWQTVKEKKKQMTLETALAMTELKLKKRTLIPEE